MELNTREIALLIWLGPLLIFIMVKRDIRRSAVAVVAALFQQKIVSVLVMAAAYVIGCVWLLAKLAIWDWSNLKTTILWSLTFAFVTLMDIKQLEQGPKAIKALAMDAMSATAIIVFIAEFYTLPLWGELLLLPLLVVLGGMLAVAEHRPEHAIVIKPLTCLQVLIFLGLLAFSTYEIIQNLRGFATIGTAREFGVPVLLSLMFLPFLFGLGVYVGYENAWVRLLLSGNRRLARYAYWRGMLAFRTNVELFRRFVRDLPLGEVKD